jgi:hypothetical protein
MNNEPIIKFVQWRSKGLLRAGSVTETEKSGFRKTEIDVGVEITEKTDNRQKITEITENSVFAIYIGLNCCTVDCLDVLLFSCTISFFFLIYETN